MSEPVERWKHADDGESYDATDIGYHKKVPLDIVERLREDYADRLQRLKEILRGRHLGR